MGLDERLHRSLKIAADILYVINGYHSSDRSRTIRLYIGWLSLYTFMQYSITFCSIPAAASDVISGIAVVEAIADVLVKCGDSL